MLQLRCVKQNTFRKVVIEFMNQTNTNAKLLKKAKVKLRLTGKIFGVEKYFSSDEVQKKVAEAKENCYEKANLLLKEASKISSVLERALSAQNAMEKITDFSKVVHDLYIVTYTKNINITKEERINLAISSARYAYINGLLRFLFEEYEPEGLSEQDLKFVRAMTGGYALPPEINEMVPELFNFDGDAIPTILMEIYVPID